MPLCTYTFETVSANLIVSLHLQLDETNDQGPVQPDLKKMQALSDDLRSLLKMDLFGVDVIIDCDTERYAVIDINFFPGLKQFVL